MPKLSHYERKQILTVRQYADTHLMTMEMVRRKIRNKEIPATKKNNKWIIEDINTPTHNQLIEYLLRGEPCFWHEIESGGLVFQAVTLRKTLTDEDKQLMAVMFESLQPVTSQLIWDLIEKGWRKEGLDVLRMSKGFSWNPLTQSFLKMGGFKRNGSPWFVERHRKRAKEAGVSYEGHMESVRKSYKGRKSYKWGK